VLPEDTEVRNWPSDEKDSMNVKPSTHSSLLSKDPVLEFQSITVPSCDAEARNRPLGEKASAWTTSQ
jgi:hypothetical protein